MKQVLQMYHGVEIPALGLGTWKASIPQAADIVRNGVALGYRHFDTARAYQNEVGVGEGIKSCGIAREELFITSKIPAEVKTYEGAKESIESSLEKIGTEYLDLMLIHWPWPWDETREYNNYFKENIQVWKAMEEALKAGKLRSIGVSNFSEADIQNIIDNCEMKPMVHQVLANVTKTPVAMLEYCRKNDIVVEAYSPNGNGNIMDLEQVRAMAEKYHVTPAQFLVKYTRQLGMVSLPKTNNIEHMKEYLALDFEIDQEDMEKIIQASQV